ncbi:hypothetical protein REPUB_Repub02eG0095800 [Reevesia pubescens]
MFDWKMHRPECRAISRLEKKWRNLVSPKICLVVRLYLRRKLQIDNLVTTKICLVVRLYLALLYCLSCIAHTITSSKMKPLGVGLYPGISIINHSCLPNSVLVFEGRRAVIRAVQHVQKGDEVMSILFSFIIS